MAILILPILFYDCLLLFELSPVLVFKSKLYDKTCHPHYTKLPLKSQPPRTKSIAKQCIFMSSIAISHHPDMVLSPVLVREIIYVLV